MSAAGNEPRWLTSSMIIAIHDEQLAMVGGGAGMRDANMLLSAIDRPKNKWHYGETDLIKLAASYCFGLAKNHPFVDGNKRTAFMAMYTFLGFNNIDLNAAEVDVVITMEKLASGMIGEDELVVWVSDHAVLLPAIKQS